jgi:uncharacterized SAM-binding protein YcdF (DUF218 family)
VNELFATFGLLDWKPLVTALLLPPLPWLVMVLGAAWLRPRRPALAAMLLLLALTGGWLSHCQGFGALLERTLDVPPALSPARVADLRRNLAGRKPVVLMLGGGVQALAPEYGEAHLGDRALQRLHYALWLGRQLQAPVMVTGGTGLAGAAASAEAEVAARIAARDYGRPLRWVETESRDTRENARLSLQRLRTEGVTDVLLVTHGWHMRRALRAFEQAADQTGVGTRIVPAPMGMAEDSEQAALRWMPSPTGYRRVHQALREMVGWAAGA